MHRCYNDGNVYCFIDDTEFSSILTIPFNVFGIILLAASSISWVHAIKQKRFLEQSIKNNILGVCQNYLFMFVGRSPLGMGMVNEHDTTYINLGIVILLME